MKRNDSTTFNKEKLIFVGTAALLAASLYHFLAARPTELTVGIAVSPLSEPAPLAANKMDSRQASVQSYVERGLRKNPFQPVDDGIEIHRDKREPASPRIIPVDYSKKPGQTPLLLGLGPDPETNAAPTATAIRPVSDDSHVKADFSAVIRMNDNTVGLLKVNGHTLQVRSGDALDEQHCTVAKIGTQAIWITDRKDRQFMARDTTFDADARDSSGKKR